MNGDYRLFKFKKGILAYKKAGSGAQILFAFHGHGQDHTAFNSLVEQLGNRFTIYSFDLFFHGKSEWPENDPISKAEWESLISEFLTHENITRFNLLGFSLGAKLVLVTLESFASKIDSIYLIAPDGIKKNIWYSVATSPWAKSFFRSLIKKPKRFDRVLSWARALRLVDGHLQRFAKTQMESEQQRNLVYNSWMMFSDIKFDLSQIASLISKSSIRATVIVGSRDNIISPIDVTRLTSLANEISLEVVRASHSNVLPRSIALLKKIN